MDGTLSVAEKRLLLALPRDGSLVSRDAIFQQIGLIASSQVESVADGPCRAGLVEMQVTWPEHYSWTDEGQKYREHGLPERQLVRFLVHKGGVASLETVERELGLETAKIAIAWAMRKKWTRIDAVGGEKALALVKGDPELGGDEAMLRALPSIIDKAPGEPSFKQLVDRKGLIEPIQMRTVVLRLTAVGREFVTSLKADDVAGAVEVNQVTPELIAKWGALSPADRAKHVLRPFDFNVPVTVPSPGKAHPLTHIIAEIREIFVALGFTEIAGDYVEPAFWNMDALFIPQNHPARDMQDTFYLKSPARAPVPDALFNTVRDVHQKGGNTGSAGWGGSFKREESERTLLRTHTTVTTIRHLAAHPKPPVRTFGIGRVFRNEAMDATHLPEFHQVEGIIVEEGATLSMLMGVLREFYKRMGFPQVKFRPSFYPYTEPSLDVAVKWGDKWLELGGAGVFRPEVTKPLGVPCNVLAWGLGLERLAMLRLGLKDIRQLYLSDVQWLRETPVR